MSLTDSHRFFQRNVKLTGSLSWFHQHEATKSITTPPGRDASKQQETPSNSSTFPDSPPIPIHPPWRREG